MVLGTSNPPAQRPAPRLRLGGQVGESRARKESEKHPKTSRYTSYNHSGSIYTNSRKIFFGVLEKFRHFFMVLGTPPIPDTLTRPWDGGASGLRNFLIRYSKIKFYRGENVFSSGFVFSDKVWLCIFDFWHLRGQTKWDRNIFRGNRLRRKKKQLRPTSGSQ